MSIPKKIHLVWFGGERPKKFEPLVNKIKEINFDYEVIEWNESNIDFQMKNYDLIQECENLGAKSDIFRFEVLYHYGGIYMDYDFIQVKKFDDLLSCDFFVGTAEDCPNETWNSIVGSCKNNQICEDFLFGLKSVSPIAKWDINRVMWETGPYYLHKVLNAKNYDLNYKRLVGKYFYPFPGRDRLSIRALEEKDIQHCLSYADENTYCIHLHTTTWQ
jgi:mannosyltransferase OCH1-like enzyme